MKANPWFAPLVLGAAMGLGPVSAEAAMITFAFGGQVTSVGDPNGILGTSIQLGDTWSGTFTFDSQTPDKYPGDPTLGDYVTDGPGMILTVGQVTITPLASAISVLNLSWGDRFYMGPAGVTEWSGLPPGISIVEWGVGLRDPTATAFQCDALPLIPPPLELFTERFFYVSGGMGGGVVFRADASFTWFTLVPEPSSMLLGLFTITLLTTRRRRARPPTQHVRF
jgi:hypothetical protein